MRAGNPRAATPMQHLAEIAPTHFSTEDLPLRDQFDAWHASISVIFDVESHAERPTDGFGASINALQFGETMLAVSPVGIAQAAKEATTGSIDGVRSPPSPLLTVNTSRY
jgi:hypothetical protein